MWPEGRGGAKQANWVHSLIERGISENCAAGRGK